MTARAATAVSSVDNCAGAHATDVGQNAVTPYFGRRRATSAHGIRAVEHVDAFDAVDVDVDESRHDRCDWRDR